MSSTTIGTEKHTPHKWYTYRHRWAHLHIHVQIENWRKVSDITKLGITSIKNDFNSVRCWKRLRVEISVLVCFCMASSADNLGGCGSFKIILRKIILHENLLNSVDCAIIECILGTVNSRPWLSLYPNKFAIHPLLQTSHFYFKFFLLISLLHF